MRFFSVIFGLVLGFVSALVSGFVFAAAPSSGMYSTQGQASAACQAYLAEHPNYGTGGTAAACVFVYSSAALGVSTTCNGFGLAQQYSLYGWGVTGQTGGFSASWGWCAQPSCVAGSTPFGSADGVVTGFNQSSNPHSDGQMCCVSFSLVAAGKNAGDPDSAGYSIGHWVRTGSRCTDGYSGSLPYVPNLKPAPAPCAGSSVASCWDPFRDAFCSQSESGEWFCIPRGNPPPGGCISGATGSECYSKDGNPVPPPPDPPIRNGTPPDTINNYTINNGGTTNSYTTNNYSGTSPGPGSSSSGGSSPPSSSPGGTGSNVGGNGNTGANGTDSNGNCPNGSKPTASGCSGTYRDDGCNTPPACFGDAVLCGIAANTHKTACEAASGSSTGAPPSGMGDGTDNSGDPTASSVSNEVETGDTSSLNSSGFGFSTSCPLTDGIHFSFLGQSIDVDESSMCTPLGFIYYIVLAFAYFSAAKIIAGVK